MVTIDEQKTTNKKPIFLLPLPFDEVFAALLQANHGRKKESNLRRKTRPDKSERKSFDNEKPSN